MKKLALMLALSPATLAAQTGTTFSTYVAADDGVAGAPTMVGVTIAREVGPLGLRLGGAVDANSTPLGDASAEGVGVTAGDLDLLLSLGPLMPDAPVVPYALAGMGAVILSDAAAASSAFTGSYGAGLRIPLSSRLSMESELRYRQALGSDPTSLPRELSGGLEYRFGMNVRVSGSSPAAARGPLPVNRPRPATRDARLPTGAGAARDDAAAARLALAAQALDTADDLLGVPYKWGGNSPADGFDCSGFVRYVFARHGVHLPRVSRDQALAGAPLPTDLFALEPGDLIAFASNGSTVDHIAIYAGDGKIIHSSSARGGVRYDQLDAASGAWYLRHMVAARRVIETPWLWSYSSSYSAH